MGEGRSESLVEECDFHVGQFFAETVDGGCDVAHGVGGLPVESLRESDNDFVDLLASDVGFDEVDQFGGGHGVERGGYDLQHVGHSNATAFAPIVNCK